MFAINHASASLLFKKHTRNEVSFVWLLVAVQFIELLWVTFNLLGIEKVTTEAAVHYVGDIHLSYMPYSHSILSSAILSGAVLIGFGLWKSWRIGIIMGLALLSHIILDFITHTQDLPLGYANDYFVGLGLYDKLPILGFFLELGFGLFCWWYVKGSRTLFWIILIFNLANLTMFLPQVDGLEAMMANQPTLIVVVILIQIVVTLALVGWAVDKQEAAKD